MTHMPSSRPKHRKGFTLIEVLVVIGVVTILAAILVPVGARSKLRALQAVSQSQMRQHFIAVAAYAADYDDRLVFGVPLADADRKYVPDDLLDIAKTAPIVEENLAGYGLEKALLHAPNDPGFDVSLGKSYFELIGTSYVMRRRATLLAVPMTYYDHPASEPLEWEMGIYYDPTDNIFSWPKHNNVLFFDGSVKYQTRGETFRKLGHNE